ncbi:nucleotidyltransferase family protein [Anabaenopsis tanganyikae CS-531]|jgi:predicted nucleotidyltransferase|uniref:Nucleotidyltransferase family protein n=3 Tax=Anabaenopsis TaxID=110103 RepID=A0A7S6RCS2_9CYAN|nr:MULTISPECIES: nucleotidyltransferase family protein [Nostocales]MDB9447256.1 nucleotidyltransferase family protein [Anabaena sp. CS-542/02]MDB9538095.1 nucleotidyltransferase family protein [Anabaenopsis arnoldii]MDH6091703.1 nucleotidyltransferase family protein [Anabaenopsis arnoldii]MDH6107056.1 nucleotidyltransferase family protein [Anabaenopsis tanganyikae CS-531]QOV22567.1 nucleotidyltransferase family protein [Anabaenopsis elenkinii CCIBt3563]
MGIDEILTAHREEILRIAAEYGGYNVRVFGSIARGEARVDSDIDFLMEIEPQRTLLDQIALMQSLEELLGRKVDITEPDNLHEVIRERVLEEAVFL